MENKSPHTLSPQKLALLKMLRDQKKTGPQPIAITQQTVLSQRKDQETFPLSSQQQQLWFEAQLAFGDSLAHVSAAWSITGDLDSKRLKQSFQKVMQHHQILNCVFTNREGTPQQHCLSSNTADFQLVTLSHLELPTREQQLSHQLTQGRERPFDLVNGPLLRAHLFCLESSSFVLQLTLHPLIADYYSLTLILQELAFFYHATEHSPPQKNTSTSLQYADYAAWQASWLDSTTYNNQLAFWQQQLSTIPPHLELPIEIGTNLPRPNSFNECYEQHYLPANLTQTLGEFCQREQCSALTLFQATWLALLYRYTAQPEIMIGQYVDNRKRQELKEIIGPFATFLPVRYRLSHQLTVRALLEQVQSQTNLIAEHQEVPLERITALVAPEHQPQLLQYTFSSTHNSPSNTLFTDLSLEFFTAIPPTLPDVPGLCIGEEANQYLITMSYPARRFAAPAMHNLYAHYLILLTHFLTHPQHSILQGEILKPAERQQLLVLSNHPTSHPEPPLTPQHIHLLFEEQAKRTPTSIALIYEKSQITYQELNARANQLAWVLMEQGIQAEQTVGVALERSLELIISLLAVLKAGGAYVPLDPALPAQRLAHYMQDAHLALILTHSRLQSRLPAFTGPVLCLDQDTQQINQASTTTPSRSIAPDQLAYIIYTSGSTGLPKGAMNSHAGICNRLVWMKEQYQLGPHERFLQKTPYSFDVSVGEIFSPLISGACLILAEPDGHKDPAYLVRLVIQEAITTLHFVPSMLRFFLEEPGVERCTSLRRVMCSGEALSLDLQARFFQCLPTVELHNLYGPTEAAVEVSFWNCQPGADEQSVPIGRPISHVSLYVLDARLQLVPPGVPGDLYIGGIQPGRGYIQQPERTAEAFLPDPFGHGSRIYRTGDRARLRHDGAIEYLGRADQQIKIAGHRIELGEIEVIMTRHPLLKQAVALVRDSPSQQKQLVAYLVPATVSETSSHATKSHSIIAQLRSYLQTQLPDYMVPSVFVVLSELPLTPSGKLDTLALPAPDTQQLRPSLTEEFEAPRSQVEQVLADIVLELLQIPRPGIYDNLFELGANSLHALQLLMRLRQQLHINLTVKNIFQAPTIAGLATLIEQQGHNPVGNSSLRHAPILPLEPVPRDQTLLLSFAQQRLWFLDQLYPGQVSYIIPLVLQLKGSLHVQALRQSLQTIVWRHEVLRTVIQNDKGQPIQKILPPFSVPLLLHDLSTLPDNEREQQAQHWIKHEIQTPFDLANGPLLRLRLLRLHAQEHLLLVTMHHIVSDGWSIAVMWKELTTLYNAFSSGKPSPLTPLSIQYADFSVWQRKWLQGERLEQQLAYWKTQLRDCPTSLPLPLDHPRPAFQTFHGGIKQFYVPPTLTTQLRSLSRTQNVTLFMLLLATFKVLLCDITGQTDLVVGSPVANRNSVEIEPLIGFFVNTLALRTNLSGNPSFLDILQRVKETTLEGYDHQDIPFEQVVESVQNTRDAGRSPLFQVFFTLQNMPLSSMELINLRIEPVSSNYQVAKFDLTLGFNEGDTVLAGALEYNATLFEAATIAALQIRLIHLLEIVVDQPTLPLDALIEALHTQK